MTDLESLLSATRRGLGSLKVVFATGLYKTAAGALGARSLDDNRVGLRAYLTVQLSSVEAATHALRTLDAAVREGSVAFDGGPTRRAALFRAARVLVRRARDERSDRIGLGGVPWEPPSAERPPEWEAALDDVRGQLSGREAEVLELRFGRGLDPAEIAYALDVPEERVADHLRAGLGYVKFLLEDQLGASLDLSPILGELFAVQGPSPAELATARAKVAPLPSGTLIGARYEILERVGGGEFAFVYRARDVQVPGHVVALKLLHERAQTPFAREGAIRELSLIASAFHPSLVQFKEHGWFEERLWFVMPFYRGETLLARLERGVLPLDEALTTFEGLARGLAALHAAGIRHQDVKPENIFLVELTAGPEDPEPERLPLLLDLGVAAPNGEMALAGTPMYFPPEVAARIVDIDCDVPLTAKADVFALSLSLLHALEAPDLGGVAEQDVETFLSERAEGLVAGPQAATLRELRPAFARWLAKDPAERPTAVALAAELAALRDGAAPARRRPRPRRRLSASWVLAPILAVALVSLDPLVGAPPPRTAQPAISRAEDDPALAGLTLSETSRARLLAIRLRVEAQRAAELEAELGELRRAELGLDDPGDP